MEIKASDIRFSIIQAPGAGPQIPAPVFRLGEILSAYIVSKQPPDQYTLQIGSHAVQARSDQPLTPGQTLRLEVATLHPQLELKIVTAATAEHAVAQAARQLLPQQGPLNALLSNLALITTMPLAAEAAGRSNTDRLAALVRQFFSQIPSAKQASSADGLKRILLDSGLFLEHKLLQPPSGADLDAALNHDLKAALLRFAEALRKSDVAGRPVSPGQPAAGDGGDIDDAFPLKSPADAMTAKSAQPATSGGSGVSTQPPVPGGSQKYAPALHLDERAHFPPLRSHRLQPLPALAPSVAPGMNEREILDELLRQAESSLSRMQLQQLSVLPTREEPHPVWTFEIPLRRDAGADVLQLRIEQERPGSREAMQRIWNVTLAFDLDALGPVYASVRLQDRHVSANLWVECAATQSLFREHLDTLRRHMQDHGLLTGDINCHHGKPPQPPSPAAGRGSFLDTQA